jgi:hypothetical protein
MLLSMLFVGFNRPATTILVDIPDVPTPQALNDASRSALAGLPRSKSTRSEVDWEQSMSRYRAFVADEQRRDPWAFWPESMRPRCEAASKAMTRVLLNTEPGTPHGKTAENLVRACLRALDYPEEKARSLFAAPSMN